jgi:hypothetical protein
MRHPRRHPVPVRDNAPAEAEASPRNQDIGSAHSTPTFAAVNHGVDRLLGARVAFGPSRLDPVMLDWLDEFGHDTLFGADTPERALLGGLAIRVVRLERALVADVAA